MVVYSNKSRQANRKQRCLRLVTAGAAYQKTSDGPIYTFFGGRNHEDPVTGVHIRHNVALDHEYDLVKDISGGSGDFTAIVVPRRYANRKFVLKFFPSDAPIRLGVRPDVYAKRILREIATMCVLSANPNAREDTADTMYFPVLYSYGDTGHHKFPKKWLHSIKQSRTYHKVHSKTGLFVIMSYLSNYEGLDDFNLKNPKYSDELKIELLIGLVESLVAASTLTGTDHFVHGDLHPGNMLVQLSEDGRHVKNFKLIDMESTYYTPDRKQNWHEKEKQWAFMSDEKLHNLALPSNALMYMNLSELRRVINRWVLKPSSTDGGINDSSILGYKLFGWSVSKTLKDKRLAAELEHLLYDDNLTSYDANLKALYIIKKHAADE